MRNSRWKLIILLLLTVTLVFNVQAQQKHIVFSQESTMDLVGNSVLYLEDPSATLNAEQAYESLKAGKFTQNQRSILTFPASESAYWICLSVKNESKEPIFAVFGSTFAWHIDCYEQSTNGELTLKKAGGSLNSKESYVESKDAFRFILSQGLDSLPRSFLFRVQTEMPLELPIFIGNEEQVTRHERINERFAFLFLGCIGALFIYNLFLNSFYRTRAFYFYIGHLVWTSITITFTNNFPLVEYVFYGLVPSEFWYKYILVWANPVMFACQGLFCVYYLELPKKLPIFAKLIWFVLAVLCIGLPMLNLLSTFDPQLVLIGELSVVILLLLCLSAGFIQAIKGERDAIFYTVGWLMVISGAIVFMLVINGALEYSHFGRHAMYIGVALEASVFSYALSDKFRRIKRDAISANEKLLEQTIENERILKEQNQELDRLVAERTKELSNVNDELQSSMDELNEQSKRLVDLNHTKDKLFAIISHDLRSPILSLKVVLNFLNSGMVSEEEFQSLTQEMKSKVDGINFTMENLLNWAKNQLQGIQTRPKLHNIKEICQEMAIFVEETSKSKQIHIENLIQEGCIAFCDREQISLIFRNLLSNAVKFSQPKSVVTISCEVTGPNELSISISDSGKGIDNEVLSTLFEKHHSTFGTAGEKGAGLGLMLCKEFAEKNGGTLSVNSKVGEGTKVTLTLPIQQP